MIRAVVTTNTVPNCNDCDDKGHDLISPNNGLAGMSGPAIFPIGLGQVKQWRAALNEYPAAKDEVEVIGVGGISQAEHVFKYLSRGATATQVGTAYFEAGENIFSEMLQQYVELREAFDPATKFVRESPNF
jgi:dihydroorotate dehydrogenase (fumarate)